MSKTRTHIINQVYDYLPNLDVSSYDTTLDNLIDLAAEEISRRHNFSYLRATTPATYTLSAGDYYVNESDFSFTNFKEVIFLHWIKSSTGENARIHFLPQQDFLSRYPYVEYSGNSQGKPRYYTRIGSRYLFSSQLDEAVTVRAWYQKLHGNFADDTAEHLFDPDNLGFQAIVASVLSEAQEAIPGIQLSQKAMEAVQRKEYWINQLIEYDLSRSNEPIEIEPLHRRGQGTADVTDPYDWV